MAFFVVVHCCQEKAALCFIYSAPFQKKVGNSLKLKIYIFLFFIVYLSSVFFH